MKRVPKRPPPAVRTWVVLLARNFQAKRCAVPKDGTLEKLAGALVLVSSDPEDEEARKVYWSLCALFAKTERQARWSQATALIPADRERILRISECVRVFQDEFRGISFSRARINLETTIRVMLEIPDARAYVRHCKEGGLNYPGAVFHPNTLRRAKQSLRGVFGYGDQSKKREEIRRKVRVVED